MSERELQDAVIETARLLGFKVAHFRPAQSRTGRWLTAMQGDTGYPDLTLAGHGRLLFLELKSAKGRVSKQQAEWIAALEGVNSVWKTVEVHVFRPADWTSGMVEAVLRGQA